MNRYNNHYESDEGGARFEVLDVGGTDSEDPPTDDGVESRPAGATESDTDELP